MNLLKGYFLPDLRDVCMKKLFVIVLMVVAGLMAVGCNRVVADGAEEVGPLPENTRMVNLAWKPTLRTDELDLEPLTFYKNVTISLQSIMDVRQDPRIIGSTFNDLKVRTATIPIATRENVAKWCKNAFENTCREITITTGKKGKLRLEVEITEFSISDDYTQTGTASLRVNAFTDDEMLIWEGRIKGTSDLYVHGTDSDGISECLSNTMMVTLHNVFTDRSFRDAVGKSIE